MKKPHKSIPSPRDLKGTIRRQPVVFAVYLVLRLIVLGTLGLPIEIVGILASVEPLIDMGRTALNVSDSMVAGITSSHVNGGFNRDVFNDSNAQVSAAGEIEA